MPAGPWGNGNTRIQPAGGPAHGYSSLQQKGGAAGTDYTSTTSPMEQQYDNLRVFFGEASRDRVAKLHSDDWDDYQKENSDYPDAFTHMYGTGEDNTLSKNGFLSRVMIEKTVASLCWQVTRMAPWREHNGSLVLEWSCAKFDQHLLDKLPEESAPRLLSSSRSSGRISLLRHGIALLLEATFAETPLGRFTYLMHLEQIRVATVETACYGAMIAILEHQEWRDPVSRHSRQDAFSANALDNMFKEEVRMWGIVHKHADGFEIVKNKQIKTLSSRGSGAAHGNFTIIPQGMAQFLSQADRSAYYIEGPGSDDQIRRTQTRAMHQTIVESREFSQGENHPGHDPVFRQQTIGGFMTLDDSSVQARDVSEYRTSHMDAMGYEEDKDSYYMFRYAQHYKYTGVWNFELPDAPCTDNLGRGFLHDMGCYTWAQTYSKCRTDGTKRVVEKLFLLPPEKRQAFFDSLHLLPADSKCVDLEGHEFPRASRYDGGDAPVFDARLFNAACIDDVGVSQTVTAPEAWSYEQRDAETGRAVDRAADKRVESAAGFERRRKRPLLNDELTAEELYDLNEDAKMVDDTVVSYTRLADGSVAKVEQTASKRRVRRRFALTDEQQQQQQAAGTTASVKAKLLAVATAHNAVAELAAGLIAEWIERQPGASTADKLIQMREATRIFKAEIAQCPAPAASLVENGELAKVFTSYVLVRMTQLLGAMAVRTAIDGITTDRTQLEDACKDRSANMHATFSSATVDPCWWAPDREYEDGQVKLSITGQLGDPTLSLPHDSFAATLAANNLVVFDLAEADITDAASGLIHPEIKEQGAKRSRIDALVWSIVVSHLLVGVMAGTTKPDNLFAVIADLLATNLSEKTLRRLKRDKGLSLATKEPRTALLAQTMIGSVAARVSYALSLAVRGATDADQIDDAVANFGRARSVFTGLMDSMRASATRAEMLRAPSYVDPAIAAKEAERVAAAASGQPAPVDSDEDEEEQDEAPGMRGMGVMANQVVWTTAFILSLLQRASLASGNFFKFCVENDIPVPYYLRLWRPSKAYTMGSMIRMQADGAAAYTFYQNPRKFYIGAHAIGVCNMHRMTEQRVKIEWKLTFALCVRTCALRIHRLHGPRNNATLALCLFALLFLAFLLLFVAAAAAAAAAAARLAVLSLSLLLLLLSGFQLRASTLR